MKHTEIPHEYRDAVLSYIEDTFIQEPDVIQSYRNNSRELRIPPAEVQPVLGKYLFMTAKSIGAKRVLEIGSLWGYSGWWLWQALPQDGELVSLEKDIKHFRAAQTLFSELREQQPDSAKIDVRNVNAMEEIATFDTASFDMIFLDADKQEYPDMADALISLLRPHGVLIADNVIYSKNWPGTPAHDTDDPRVTGARNFNQLMAQHPDVDALTVPFGFGILMAVKKSESA